MKKIIATFTLVLVSFLSKAQVDRSDLNYNGEIFRTCAVIAVIVLFMVFILSILKKVLDHRLKNKIVEKGITENIASSILQTTPGEDRNLNIKWFAILAGVGIGLTLVNTTQPLGIHSIAIMAFSLSLSFLGYYFFIRHADK